MPNTRLTYNITDFNLENLEARETYSFDEESEEDVKDFCDLDMLLGVKKQYDYATLEHNSFVLDGSLTPISENDILPLVSKELSNDDGEIEYKLTIEFTSPEDFYGFSIYFEKDYPKHFTIKTTDEYNQEREMEAQVDKLYYIFQHEFRKVVKVELIFEESMLKDHYVKINRILFGQIIHWEENDIIKGKLQVEADRTSDNITTNTFDFDIYDKTDDYNLGNETGIHNYFQRNQPVNTWEYVNGNEIFLGCYFLDTFSVKDNIVSLSCNSYIGLLDTIQFNDGQIYSEVEAGVILDSIFDTAGIDSNKIQIDEEVYNTLLSGTIKPMTCREALREVLFASQAIITTIGEPDGVSIIISKADNELEGTIGRDRKFSTKIDKLEYTYGVDLTYTSYILNSEEVTIIEDEEYEKGRHTITFDSAYSDLKVLVNGTQITPETVSTYYCVINLPSTSTITIKGKKYEENEVTITKTRPYLRFNEPKNIKSYSTTLCSSKQANALLKELLRVNMNEELEFDIQYIENDTDINNYKHIENSNSNYSGFVGSFESKSVDLTGGFITQAKLKGNYYQEAQYFTGTELYAGEEVGIL